MHLRPGQPRRDRVNPQMRFADHDYCTTCDNPGNACRCALLYILTRTNEAGRTVYYNAGNELLLENVAMPFGEVEVLDMMERLNGSIYDQAHQWGIKPF